MKSCSNYLSPWVTLTHIWWLLIVGQFWSHFTKTTKMDDSGSTHPIVSPKGFCHLFHKFQGYSTTFCRFIKDQVLPNTWIDHISFWMIVKGKALVKKLVAFLLLNSLQPLNINFFKLFSAKSTLMLCRCCFTWIESNKRSIGSSTTIIALHHSIGLIQHPTVRFEFPH